MGKNLRVAHNHKHRWKFFRAGGLDQVAIRHGSDIIRLPELDQKLWVALSCPTRGIEFDQKTLDLIDTDKDGRIRVYELLGAVKWMGQNLKNPDELLKGSSSLPLASINDSVETGATLLAGARRILANLGKPDAANISCEDTVDTKTIFAQTKFNGDGVVPIESAQEPEIQKVIQDIMDTLGAELDRSGKPGVNLQKVETFFLQTSSLAEWAQKGESSAEIMVAGKATWPAAAAVVIVRQKIEDYFARCRLAEFDARAEAPLNRAETEFALIALKNLTIHSEEISQLPLAHIQAGKPLSLREGLNPAWAAAVSRFAVDAVDVLLGPGKSSLTEEEWNLIVQKLIPFQVWNSSKPVTAVEKLGLERVTEILKSNARQQITELIESDKALEVENAQINAVDKFVHLYRDLNRLIHNYVNLADFYDPKYPATFQVGTLYIDTRACDLCFHIEDLARHATLSTPSKIFLAYCEIVRPSTKEKRTICAAFTSGFSETLWVGRNGIFYDRQGNDWDAVIVKVVENPISLKEAFWMPWRKIATLIGDQFKKMLAAREAAVLAAASKTVEGVAKSGEAAKPVLPTVPKLDGAAIASSVAAIGIAVGLLSQAAAMVVGATKGIEIWQAVLGVAAVILAVSGPSVILAYFKLRARDLAPILNACGWAVNSRIRMTLALGRELTQEARLPRGAERQLTDPYAEDNTKRNLLIVTLIFFGVLYGLWKFDVLNESLPDKMKHRTATNVVVTLTGPASLSTNAPSPGPGAAK
ncbi:MAG TPA: hypothetical protein VMZ27_18055 [Candidatus Saccharimonadales bacterium]|nr:hypothetical protein [Candidatus Saccharimonadales bacterium]